jgi:hypothetical protein
MELGAHRDVGACQFGLVRIALREVAHLEHLLQNPVDEGMAGTALAFQNAVLAVARVDQNPIFERRSNLREK